MLGSKLARYACGAPLTAKVFTYSVNSFALGTRPRMSISHALALIGAQLGGPIGLNRLVQTLRKTLLVFNQLYPILGGVAVQSQWHKNYQT